MFIKKGIEEEYVRPDIEIIPTIFYLWSGISEVIRFADMKKEYLKMRLGIEKEDYMQYGFDMLLKSIRR